jgi:hypothetical protein
MDNTPLLGGQSHRIVAVERVAVLRSFAADCFNVRRRGISFVTNLTGVYLVEIRDQFQVPFRRITHGPHNPFVVR